MVIVILEDFTEDVGKVIEVVTVIIKGIIIENDKKVVVENVRKDDYLSEDYDTKVSVFIDNKKD